MRTPYARLMPIMKSTHAHAAPSIVSRRMWQSLALPESTNAVPSTQDDIFHFELQHLLPEVTRASRPEGFASPDNQPRTFCADDIEDDRTVHGGSIFKFLAPPAHTRKTKPQPTGIGPDAFRRYSGSRPSTVQYGVLEIGIWRSPASISYPAYGKESRFRPP